MLFRSEKEENIHSQWDLISTDPSTVIPLAIEQKWFDSLCGADQAGRPVPDILLPPKLKYGVNNRPRQSMFVNRFEALKQLIEQANRVLVQYQVVDQFDLSLLESYDPIPNIIDGRYDSSIDTYEELPYVNINKFKLPVLKPEIVNGRITGVIIVDAGSGYINAPFIDISGSGTGAIVKSTINTYEIGRAHV